MFHLLFISLIWLIYIYAKSKSTLLDYTSQVWIIQMSTKNKRFIILIIDKLSQNNPFKKTTKQLLKFPFEILAFPFIFLKIIQYMNCLTRGIES